MIVAAEAPLARAEAAIGLVETDPDAARVAARAALVEAEERDHDEAVAVALRALGLALRELGEFDEAQTVLRRAIDRADRAGLRERAAEARMSLALTLGYLGRTRAALREADRAADGLRGAARAEVLMQRCLLLQRFGRLAEALDGYRRALPVVRRAGDKHLEARLLLNRGVLHAYRGALAAAEADLSRCASLATEIGRRVLATKARHNLGFVAARRGDAPRALALYDEIDAEYRRLGLGMLHAVAQVDRCEVLLGVRLIPEARRAAAAAAEELERANAAADHAEALLLVSEAALLGGDTDAAAAAARSAEEVFVRQRRPGWTAVARLAVVRAEWEAGTRTPESLRAAQRARAAVAATGLPGPALEAGLIAARIALALGRPQTARRELAEASRRRGRGSAELRARAWHAEALLRLEDGDERAAEAALRAGLRAIEEGRAALGATELRAHVTATGAELAQLGLRLALDRGSAEAALGWAERWRAGSLAQRPVRPPADERMAADLAELRMVAGDLQAAALADRDVAALLRRQAALEERIRRRARHAPGGGARAVSFDRRRLAAALGERALVELVERDGELHAISLAGRRMRLHALGPRGAVLEEIDALRFALRRLALGGVNRAATGAAAAAAEAGLQRLDALLLGPLHGEIAGRPLVVVPTGRLHALPWAALPSCAGRPLSVTPSAALWLRAGADGHDAGDDVAFVAGPELPGADDEVRTLARSARRPRVLTGTRATIASTLEALDGARLAHVAAHGSFRSDNPQFSALRLADGPLTVYDLERLERAPACLVLSACDAGLSSVRPGDELMGLVAALLSLGTGAVVASVTPVSDAATVPVMLELHERLRAGDSPAVALAATQAAATGEGALAAASFVCFGCG